MRSFLFVFLIFAIATSGLAQKSIVKDIDATSLELLQVDVDNIYRLEVKTTDSDRFRAYMNTEGEFATQMVLNLLENGGSWNLNVGFAPGFTPADDKLGAHKVVSVDLSLEIPKGKYLKVSGRCLTVKLSGMYTDVEVRLEAGNLNARNFKASGLLATKDGDIKVYGQEDVAVRVEGTPDKLINELKAPAANNLTVMTNSGSIKVRKAKN